MPWDILSKALLKSNTPPLTHCASHFNTEGNQVGQAWFALFYWCDWILPVSLSFMCLEITLRRTLHSPPQEWCKADWAAVLWIFHLVFSSWFFCFKNSCNLCYFLVIEVFLCLWKTDPCPQTAKHWPTRSTALLWLPPLDQQIWGKHQQFLFTHHSKFK